MARLSGAAKADMEADMEADIEDGGETIGLIAPLSIGADARGRASLNDLALDLAARAAGLRRSLPAGIASTLADLVRAMNCYYSNLIEGHDTHPVAIERALAGNYSTEPEKRSLQLEAKAHIAVQAWIDGGGIAGSALTAAALSEIHRRFCELLPDDLLWVRDPRGGESARVVPGAWRTRRVQVGRHVPVSPGAIPRFLARFEHAYARLGRMDAILAAATAHHRLLWLHPFLDGNGRVARLMSHAVLGRALESGGIWSIARGLARNEADYKGHLAACDRPRRNDLDGRGHLSEEALVRFTAFFLEVCIDQVAFMESLVQPARLRRRILAWAEEEAAAGHLPPRAGAVLEAVLYRGELPRAAVAGMFGIGERQARRILSALVARGALRSDRARAPLRLAFPAALAPHWLPGLFPEQEAG